MSLQQLQLHYYVITIDITVPGRQYWYDKTTQIGYILQFLWIEKLQSIQKNPVARTNKDIQHLTYLVWGFEKPVDSSNLIDKGDIFPESVLRRSGRLRKIGAVEWISII